MSQSDTATDAGSDRIRLPRIPSPGVPRPEVAWPTVALAVALLVAWSAMTWGALTGAISLWVTMPVHAFVSFGMFTVLHDAAHRGLGKRKVVNEVLGRVAVPFVASYSSFPLFRHIHLTHHRFVNEGDELDPDSWMIHGPSWQLPLRWMLVDVHYASFYLKGWRERPRKEINESVAVAFLAVVAIAGLVVAGHGVELALVYLVPQRIALVVLAWWFDWLPHHGLDGTTTDRRLQSTRNIIGWEKVLTPLLFSQNYHLLHHVHPIVPFYRYVQAWRNGEEAYLAHDPALSTVSGRPIDPDDYRAIRGIAEPATTPA